MDVIPFYSIVLIVFVISTGLALISKSKKEGVKRSLGDFNLDSTILAPLGRILIYGLFLGILVPFMIVSENQVSIMENSAIRLLLLLLLAAFSLSEFLIRKK